MQEMKEQLRRNIMKDSTEEVFKVTGEVAKEAACKMKPGKWDVSERYTSEAILNAPTFYLTCLLQSTGPGFLMAR